MSISFFKNQHRYRRQLISDVHEKSFLENNVKCLSRRKRNYNNELTVSKQRNWGDERTYINIKYLSDIQSR